jgi:hypothetical protein
MGGSWATGGQQGSNREEQEAGSERGRAGAGVSGSATHPANCRPHQPLRRLTPSVAPSCNRLPMQAAIGHACDHWPRRAAIGSGMQPLSRLIQPLGFLVQPLAFLLQALDLLLQPLKRPPPFSCHSTDELARVVPPGQAFGSAMRPKPWRNSNRRPGQVGRQSRTQAGRQAGVMRPTACKCGPPPAAQKGSFFLALLSRSASISRRRRRIVS